MIVTVNKETFKEIKIEDGKNKNEKLILTELSKILARQFIEEVVNNENKS